MSRGRRILIAIDQLLNAIFNGWPDETLSSRAYRWHKAGKRSWPMRLIDAAFRLIGDKDHCYNSYMSEKQRTHLPPAFRGEP
ncbi:MAG: pseudouridine synthase [Betaproteobacteria bacterium]|nr:pseudouridine synthase [Betaproteobacteria bacterium]